VGKWKDKFVIGLTGNIGTGKSVVRRMLENLGAYGIDADRIAHQATAQGSPAYVPVVEMFGKYILNPDGEINRTKLGQLVFSDPDALNTLEGIVHPYVIDAIDTIVRNVTRRVIVIEAIKLVESGLADACDSIWVTYTPREIQIQRLVEKRKMSVSDAENRIKAQTPQRAKISIADIVISNDGTLHATWELVSNAYHKIIPADVTENNEDPDLQPIKSRMKTVRGKPQDALKIAKLINKSIKPKKEISDKDIKATFGELAYLLIKNGEEIIGILGWQVENLVSKTIEIILDQDFSPIEILPKMIKAMEDESIKLQCEIALIFATEDMAKYPEIWSKLGYAIASEKSFKIKAWQEALSEFKRPNTVIYFKQLREERVLKPM